MYDVEEFSDDLRGYIEKEDEVECEMCHEWDSKSNIVDGLCWGCRQAMKSRGE